MQRGAGSFVAAHRSAQATDLSLPIEEGQLVGDGPIGFPTVAGKELDDAQLRFAGLEHDLIVRAILGRHAGREQFLVPEAQEFLLRVQSAALNEGRIAQHEPAFEVLREKQGARESLKEQAKLARRQRIEPALLLVPPF